MTESRSIRLGTRGSALALAQSRWVAGQLSAQGCAVQLEIIHTTGDRIHDRAFNPQDGRGVFVAEIERALTEGAIDLAVHSMKDLPGEMPAALRLAAVPLREDPRDVLVGGSARTLAALRPGAVVGTSSLRRRAQLLAARPDIQVADMRGNVDTRLRKLDEGHYDAICLAAAGLHRLGLAARVTEYFDAARVLSAVGQGALALQTRADEHRFDAALAPLHHEPTCQAVRAERRVLAALGGGCAVPLGVLGTVDGEHITVTAVLCSLDGKKIVRETLTEVAVPEEIGAELARRLLAAAHRAGIELPPTCYAE